MMRDKMNVYKHRLEDDRTVFTVHTSCMEAELLLLQCGYKPVRLIEYKEVSEVEGCPKQSQIWKIK